MDTSMAQQTRNIRRCCAIETFITIKKGFKTIRILTGNQCSLNIIGVIESYFLVSDYSEYRVSSNKRSVTYLKFRLKQGCVIEEDSYSCFFSYPNNFIIVQFTGLRRLWKFLGRGGGTRLFEARAYWRKYRSHLVEAPVQRFQKFSLSVRRLASVFSVHLELSLAIASLFLSVSSSPSCHGTGTKCNSQGRQKCRNGVQGHHRISSLNCFLEEC